MPFFTSSSISSTLNSLSTNPSAYLPLFLLSPTPDNLTEHFLQHLPSYTDRTATQFIEHLVHAIQSKTREEAVKEIELVGEWVKKQDELNGAVVNNLTTFLHTHYTALPDTEYPLITIYYALSTLLVEELKRMDSTAQIQQFIIRIKSMFAALENTFFSSHIGSLIFLQTAARHIQATKTNAYWLQSAHFKTIINQLVPAQLSNIGVSNNSTGAIELLHLLLIISEFQQISSLSSLSSDYRASVSARVIPTFFNALQSTHNITTVGDMLDTKKLKTADIREMLDELEGREDENAGAEDDEEEAENENEHQAESDPSAPETSLFFVDTAGDAEHSSQLSALSGLISSMPQSDRKSAEAADSSDEELAEDDADSDAGMIDTTATVGDEEMEHKYDSENEESSTIPASSTFVKISAAFDEDEESEFDNSKKPKNSIEQPKKRGRKPKKQQTEEEELVTEPSASPESEEVQSSSTAPTSSAKRSTRGKRKVDLTTETPLRTSTRSFDHATRSTRTKK